MLQSAKAETDRWTAGGSGERRSSRRAGGTARRPCAAARQRPVGIRATPTRVRSTRFRRIRLQSRSPRCPVAAGRGRRTPDIEAVRRASERFRRHPTPSCTSPAGRAEAARDIESSSSRMGPCSSTSPDQRLSWWRAAVVPLIGRSAAVASCCSPRSSPRTETPDHRSRAPALRHGKGGAARLHIAARQGPRGMGNHA